MPTESVAAQCRGDAVKIWLGMLVEGLLAPSKLLYC